MTMYVWVHLIIEQTEIQGTKFDFKYLKGNICRRFATFMRRQTRTRKKERLKA